MRKILTFTVLIVFILFGFIISYYAYEIHEAKNYTQEVILKDLQKNQWRKPDRAPRKLKISAKDLSQRHVEILLKVQDPGFYDHNGVDLSTPGAGLTTITQSIVKKLYFKNFKAGIAKIKQSLIARFVADQMIAKDDQLTLFINLMYFGKVDDRPIIGLESASKAYWNKSVKVIDEEQFISLIAMIVSPKTFHIRNHPTWNKERTNRIKDLVAGNYKPKGLMDQYYGKLPQEVINAGLPAFSYFSDLYENEE